MATEVTIDSNGRVVESEERWKPVTESPYILTPEDARNLRTAAGDKQLRNRLAKWKELQPLFAPDVWPQVLAHIEGME